MKGYFEVSNLEMDSNFIEVDTWLYKIFEWHGTEQGIDYY